jgi:EAL domain-containing protein (putative c-di-GMP-specific phosphodiesterase class I)
VAKAGCLYGQGFLVGRPAPAERMEAYLESHSTGRGGASAGG